MKYEKVNTLSSYVLILPQNHQTMQVWFGKKKRSLRGKKEAQKEPIEAIQVQKTSTKSLQDGSIEDVEDIEDIKNIEGIKDIENIENIENIEGIENIKGIKDIENIENIENIEGIEDIEGIEESEAMGS